MNPNNPQFIRRQEFKCEQCGKVIFAVDFLTTHNVLDTRPQGGLVLMPMPAHLKERIITVGCRCGSSLMVDAAIFGQK